MWLGFREVLPSESEVRRLVCHEFGHALGLLHEHQHPQASQVTWNRQAIMNAYNWSAQQVINNIENRYTF